MRRIKNIPKCLVPFCTLLVLLFLLNAIVLLARPIDESEALAVADLWYAMELNSDYSKIDIQEKKDRISSLSNKSIYYMASEHELLDYYPADQMVWAYIVTYKPTGYIVVSGDDRFNPVKAFDIESKFKWDKPEKCFLNHFLGIWIKNAKICLKSEENAEWIQIRNKLNVSLSDVIFNSKDGSTYVLYETARWGQGTFYDDTVIANNGNISGIPTGCTATAMAIKMRFHEWPLTGEGIGFYSDVWGSVNYSHYVNFSQETYNWSQMPTESLSAPNSHVADLMYHCGVSVQMDYEIGGSGAWPTTSSMNNNFRYKGTEEAVFGHEIFMRKSILGGLPVVVSSSAHTVLADGYRDTELPYFHLNVGWESTHGWYDIYTEFPGGDPCIERSYPYCSPENYIYVDSGYSGIELGLLQMPFRNFGVGVAFTPSDGQLWVKGGTYSGAGTVIDKPMVINNYEGIVVIQ